MDEPRPTDIPALIQAQRFELVDDEGRVRAVLGDVGGPGGYAPGLVLRDAEGNDRSCCALFPDGPLLSFDVGGNDVLTVGVVEELGQTKASPDFDPTALLSLCDGDGQLRWGVTVHHRGGVEIVVDGEPTGDGDPA